MNELELHVKKQIQELEEIIASTKEFLKTAPSGSLRIAQKTPRQYYWVTKETGNKGKYIRKSDIIIAKQLAQKDYARKLYEKATTRKKELETCKSLYNEDEIKKFHEYFSSSRQFLIQPYTLDDETFAEQWMNSKTIELERLTALYKNSAMNNIYLGARYSYPIDPENSISTERGEVVRSKSEKILADKLFMLKIPYIYEMPLQVKDYGYLTPDFTILNKRTRKEYYWEHFGQMDNPEYSEKAIKKINTYERNHIYQGKQLLLSFETSTQYPNTKQLDSFIKQFLL